MKYKLIVLLALFISINNFSHGQKSLNLSLDSARQYSIAHNKILKNSMYNIDKATYALREAISNGLPQVSSTFDYNNALGAKITLRMYEGAKPVEIDIKPQSNFNLNVNQLLFSGSYIIGVQLSKIFKEISEINYQRTELDVVSQVTDTYYLVQLSERLLSILQQNADNLNSIYEKNKTLGNIGLIEQTDLDLLSIQVNSLQNSINSAKRQNELSKNMMLLQIGEKADTEIILTTTLESLISSVSDDYTNNSINKTINDNIDFKLSEMQELVNKKRINMAKSHALPTLSAFYRYTYKLIKPEFDMSPSNIVGIQMNLPIFSGLVRQNQLKQAKVDLYIAENNKDYISEQLKIQEKQLKFNFNNALETYNLQEKNIKVAREVYKNLKIKFEQGVLSGLELITADNNNLKAETEYYSSILQLLNSKTQLQKFYNNIK